MIRPLSKEDRHTLYDQRYRMESPIGAGSSGVVWRAVDTDSGAEVAVKRIRVISAAH